MFHYAPRLFADSAYIASQQQYVGEIDGDTKKQNTMSSLVRVLDRLSTHNGGFDDDASSSNNI